MRKYKVYYASNIDDKTVISLDTDDRMIFIGIDKFMIKIASKEYNYHPGFDAPILMIDKKLNPDDLIGKEVEII